MDDAAAQEVAAMQFAGGRSIAHLAAEWERDADWVEQAIRHALLESIPVRDGGLKAARKDVRAERAEELQTARAAQGTLEW